MTAGLPNEPDGLPQVNRANEEHSPGRLARRKPVHLSACGKDSLHDFCGRDIPATGAVSSSTTSGAPVSQPGAGLPDPTHYVGLLTRFPSPFSAKLSELGRRFVLEDLFLHKRLFFGYLMG
jgi:hypothetical protein